MSINFFPTVVGCVLVCVLESPLPVVCVNVEAVTVGMLCSLADFKIYT